MKIETITAAQRWLATAARMFGMFALGAGFGALCAHQPWDALGCALASASSFTTAWAVTIEAKEST